jgi:osmotically-inducible protein OsmY
VARSTNNSLTLLLGIGIGATLMYFLDPERGSRRRHLVADKATSFARRGQGAVRNAAVDARNRAQGLAAEVKGRLRDDDVTDDQLAERVRAQLGHHTDNASAVEVIVHEGTVTLRGEVSADDLPKVLGTVEGVRGVERVDNQLTTAASTQS